MNGYNKKKDIGSEDHDACGRQRERPGKGTQCSEETRYFMFRVINDRLSCVPSIARAPASDGLTGRWDTVCFFVSRNNSLSRNDARNTGMCGCDTVLGVREAARPLGSVTGVTHTEISRINFL